MHRLSICIPTYNRAGHLANCLQSIIENRHSLGNAVQICVADNASTDATGEVITEASRKVPIKLATNSSNIGLARNILRAVELADGEFVWLIGDDDLLMPGALDAILTLLREHEGVDYFYINSHSMPAAYVKSFPQPFALSNLPSKMALFSQRTESGEMDFLSLVDPKISFDFLGGIYLSVFRRTKWLAATRALDATALADPRTYSHFDNTFPQITIFAHAFANSRAYFSAKALSVSLEGAREWAPMYPLVRSVRLVEALSQYRKNGLSWAKFVYCKNSALRWFGVDLLRIVLDRRESGFAYIKPLHLIASNLAYPNFYLSFIYPLFSRSFWRKLMQQLSGATRTPGNA